MERIPSLNIVAMIITMIISIILPITLCIFAKKKLKAKISSFFIGSGTFIVFSLIMEQILHSIVLGASGGAIANNIWIYGLYAGLAAAVFEEVGRFLAMKIVMKKNQNKENAFMYGAGHGGAESIILIGFTYIANLMNAALINNGAMEYTLSLLDDEIAALTIKSLSALWTSHSYEFLLAGVERVGAIVIQISLSIIIFKAIQTGVKKYFFIALGIHFAIDFLSVVIASFLPLVMVEAILLILAIIIGVYTNKFYKKLEV